ncbi:MAG: SDR family oxidoreductase [Anaerolineales bacterium]|jgi:short-subunit dehydrogenase
MTRTALITGASSGIGAAFARQLAAKGNDLILVARRESRLEQLAAECHQQHGVQAEVLVADLANLSDIERVQKRIAALEELDLLINNAGFSTLGYFAKTDPQQQHDMITVHVIASMLFTRAALPAMIARMRGGLINVASTAAFIPLVGSTNYAATKAFLVTFTHGLQAELRGTGVKVQVLCPGFTHTEFHDREDHRRSKVKTRIPGFMWMEADQVVAISLRALERSKVVCIPGFINRVTSALGRSGMAQGMSKLMLARFRKRSRDRQSPTKG